MHQIDNIHAVAVLPATESIGPNPNGYFVQNTRISQSYINSIQQEYVNLLEGAGLTLAKGDHTQLKQAFIQLITDAAAGASGLASVEDDLNPHLGGDFDLLVWQIISLLSGNIEITSDGSGKVLLNSDNVLVYDYIKHRGDLNNYIRFTPGSFRFFTNNILRLNIFSFGFYLEDSNAVSNISNDETFAANSYSTLPTQRACKLLVDNTLNTIPSISSQSLSSNLYLGPYTGAETIYGWNYILRPGVNVSKHTILTNGTLNNLYASGTWASGDTGVCTSIVITLQKNNTNTSLTLTLGRSIKTATDTTHSLSVVAGDVIRFEFVKNGSILSGVDRVISLSMKFTTT